MDQNDKKTPETNGKSAQNWILNDSFSTPSMCMYLFDLLLKNARCLRNLQPRNHAEQSESVLALRSMSAKVGRMVLSVYTIPVDVWQDLLGTEPQAMNGVCRHEPTEPECSWIYSGQTSPHATNWCRVAADSSHQSWPRAAACHSASPPPPHGSLFPVTAETR